MGDEDEGDLDGTNIAVNLDYVGDDEDEDEDEETRQEGQAAGGRAGGVDDPMEAREIEVREPTSMH